MPLFSRNSKQVTQPTVYFVNNQGSQAQAPAKSATQTRQPALDGPQNRYQINQRCIYERRLPGEAYVTAHVERLQSGIYEDEAKLSNPSDQKPKAQKPENDKPGGGKPDSAAAKAAHIYGIQTNKLMSDLSLTAYRPRPGPRSKSGR